MNQDPIINDELLIRYLQKETNQKENASVKEWISLSEDNNIYFKEFSNLYKASNFQKDYHEINVEKDWKKVERRIKETKVKKKVKKLVPSIVWKIAAGLALLISLTIYQYSNTQLITVIARNSAKKIELPDGSFVWLNKNSELSYNKGLSGTTRNIKLKGEGYFEVKKDQEKPFIVELNNTKTQVLGTQFNLKENKNKSVALVLVEGSVNFSTKKEHLIVKPSEKITASLIGKLEKSINKDLNFLSWKTKVLKFNDTPLSKVIEDINKLYKVNLLIENKELFHCNLTIEFNKESLKNILETLKVLYNIDYELQEKNNYLIKGGNC